MPETVLQEHEMEDEREERDDYQEPEDTGDAGDDGVDSEVEARARRQGWVPESEWDDSRAEAEGRRKPANFVSAQEFLDRIEQSAPMLRERLRRSDETIADMNKRLDEVGSLVKWQAKQAKAARQKAYEQGIKDAEARMRQAVSEADQEAFDEAQAEKDRLVEESKEQGPPGLDEPAEPPADAPPQQQPKVDPETDAWIRENKWFQTDGTLNAYMIEQHRAVIAEQPGLGNGRASLEEAKRRVVERFPEKFGRNPRRAAPGAVSHPSGDRAARRSSAQQRFNALPAEDRQAYDRHKKMFADRGETYTIEQFLEDYE